MLKQKQAFGKGADLTFPTNAEIADFTNTTSHEQIRGEHQLPVFLHDQTTNRSSHESVSGEHQLPVINRGLMNTTNPRHNDQHDASHEDYQSLAHPEAAANETPPPAGETSSKSMETAATPHQR